MTAPITVEIIDDPARLRAIEAPWWRLWRAAGAPVGAFGCPAWLLPWWEVFGEGDLLGAAAWARGEVQGGAPPGDRLVGLALLYRRTGAPYQPLGVGVSDHGDLLVDPATPEAGPALARAVADRLDGRDRIEWPELPAGSIAEQVFADLGAAATVETAGEASPAPVLPLPGGAPFEAIVPSGRRRRLRMAAHRAARAGGVIIRDRSRDHAAEALADLVRLQDLRWRERPETPVLADPRFRRFLAQALEPLAQAGLLRLTTAEIAADAGGAERVIAVQLGFAGPAPAAYLGAFDPAFAALSPGALLMEDAIRAALAAGAGSFRFLRGDEDYKAAWGAIPRWNRRLAVGRGGDRAEGSAAA